MLEKLISSIFATTIFAMVGLISLALSVVAFLAASKLYEKGIDTAGTVFAVLFFALVAIAVMNTAFAALGIGLIVLNFLDYVVRGALAALIAA